MDRFWTALVSAMGSWHQGKLFIEHGLKVEHDALHVLAGVLVWLLLAVILRRPITDWRPLGWLFALSLWNEAVDLWVEIWPDLGMQLGEGAKDVVLSLLVPAMLMIVARKRPQMFRRGRHGGW